MERVLASRPSLHIDVEAAEAEAAAATEAASAACDSTWDASTSVSSIRAVVRIRPQEWEIEEEPCVVMVGPSTVALLPPRHDPSWKPATPRRNAKVPKPKAQHFELDRVFDAGTQAEL